MKEENDWAAISKFIPGRDLRSVRRKWVQIRGVEESQDDPIGTKNAEWTAAEDLILLRSRMDGIRYRRIVILLKDRRKEESCPQLRRTVRTENAAKNRYHWILATGKQRYPKNFSDKKFIRWRIRSL